MSIGRSGEFLESGATAVVPVTSADGRKGGVEAGIFGKAGGAAVLADRLATSGKRESYLAGPKQVAANVRRERRTLAGGLEAVVYPQGAGFWQLPVDAFTAAGAQVVATTYLEPPPNATEAQYNEPLTPARSLLSPDQLLKIVQRLGALRSTAPIPPAPGKVMKACDVRPPTGWPAMTVEQANAAAAGCVEGGTSRCQDSESVRGLADRRGVLGQRVGTQIERRGGGRVLPGRVDVLGQP